MKNVGDRSSLLMGWMVLLIGGPALADIQVSVSPVDWQKPAQTVSAGAADQKSSRRGAQKSQKHPLGVGAGRGGTASLPGAMGPAIGLIYHKTIKCLDKPHPPKNGC